MIVVLRVDTEGLLQIGEPVCISYGSPCLGGTVYWITYHYDWQGRTTSVVLPDKSTTTYLCDDRVAGTDPAASLVTITDAGKKQKRFQMDGVGHSEDPNASIADVFQTVGDAGYDDKKDPNHNRYGTIMQGVVRGVERRYDCLRRNHYLD